MSVCCQCCVLSSRGLCDELITRPEESYRLWCVVVCDLETSWMRRLWSTGGWSPSLQKKRLRESTFLSVISDIPKSVDVLKFHRLCLLVLLIRVDCRLGWVRETDEVTLIREFQMHRMFYSRTQVSAVTDRQLDCARNDTTLKTNCHKQNIKLQLVMHRDHSPLDRQAG